MVSVKLLESDRLIASKINKAFAKEVDKNTKKNIPQLKGKISSIVSSALYRSPEIQSLSGGLLMADFGLTSDPSSSIVSTIDVKTKKISSSAAKISGGFTLTMQPIDYGNLFSLSVANQIIDGGAIPWLRWLLTFGDSIIIANYGVEYGPFGRTARAHMTKESRPFKVNSTFSGTADNNFITRAVAGVSNEIKKAIIGVMQ